MPGQFNRRLFLCEECGHAIQHGSTRPEYTLYYCRNPRCGKYRKGVKISRLEGTPAALEAENSAFKAENAALKAENAALKQQLASGQVRKT